MRISGGKARGIRLAVPTGDRVRPATDGLRQAVFSSLGERVRGARFLDLFAGSGAYGLEALSRGASGGRFVEKHPAVLALLKKNVAAVSKSAGVDASAIEVSGGDAVLAEPGAGVAPDLVFVDPPYEIIPEVGGRILSAITAWPAPDPDRLVVFEMPGEMTVAAPGWWEFKRLGRGAKQPTVAFFRPVAAAR